MYIYEFTVGDSKCPDRDGRSTIYSVHDFNMDSFIRRLAASHFLGVEQKVFDDADVTMSLDVNRAWLTVDKDPTGKHNSCDGEWLFAELKRFSLDKGEPLSCKPDPDFPEDRDEIEF